MADNGGEPLFQEERQRQILELLKRDKKVLVPVLCQQFSVTPPTIRNDLKELEARGLLMRTHGGAILSAQSSLEYNFSRRQVINCKEKQAIARAAALLVQDGDSLVLDTGTTNFELAKCLKNKKRLTVITCDFKIATYLEEDTDANVLFLGGYVKRGFHCTLGPLTSLAVENICPDKCFLSPGGLSLERGITTADILQAELRRQLIHYSTQTILLADSKKIGVNTFAIIAPLDAVDLFITDSGIRDQELEALKEAGMEVQVAPLETEIQNEI